LSLGTTDGWRRIQWGTGFKLDLWVCRQLLPGSPKMGQGMIDITAEAEKSSTLISLCHNLTH